MEFFQVVAKRYSHKTAFDSEKKVAEEDLIKIVEAGMAAPSAGNSQSPEFIIINDESVIEELRKISDNVPLNTAPAFIAVLTRPRAREVLDIATECLIADLSASTVQMLLAATALGYCCGWVDGPFVPGDAQAKICEILSVPSDRMVLLVIPVGYPAEAGPRREKKPFEQRASWNQYEVEREAQE